MLQVLLVLVCLDRQQQQVQLHLIMVLLVLLLHQEALELQLQQAQQILQHLHPHLQAQLVHLAVRLAAVQVHHLRAAVPHHLVRVPLLAVAVVVVLLLVHQDPQVEDTMVAVTKKS